MNDTMHVTVCCIVYDKDEIVLLKRQNTGYYDDYYALPGGHLEPGERVIDGIERELIEEIGLNLMDDELELKHIVSRLDQDGQYIDFVFETHVDTDLVDYSNMEKDYCSRMLYRTIDKLPNDMIPYQKDYVLESEMYLVK